MTTEITVPEIATPTFNGWQRASLTDQRLALAALDRIIALNPNLPGAHITLTAVYPELVDVQAHEWHHLEAWRIALNVAPTDVEYGNCEPQTEHIQFMTSVDGARVRVYVMGDERPAPVEDAAVSA